MGETSEVDVKDKIDRVVTEVREAGKVTTLVVVLENYGQSVLAARGELLVLL